MVVTHNSDTIFHMIARYLRDHPDKVVAYCTYSADFARRQSMKIRACCRRAGVGFAKSRDTKMRVDDSIQTMSYWQTAEGGGLMALGRGGAIMGHGVDLLVIDDPYKNAEEALSDNVNEKIRDWWRSTLSTRIEPDGSVFVFHQRWSQEDLIQYLLDEREKDLADGVPEDELDPWQYANLPALTEETNDNGDAVVIPLWPARYDEKALARIRRRVGEYFWAAQYQGDPAPIGQRLFTEWHLHEQTVVGQSKVRIISVDTASTEKTRSDYTAVVIADYWRDKDDNELRGEIVRVIRRRWEVTSIADQLQLIAVQNPGCPIVLETQGEGGKAVASILKRQLPGINLVEVTTTRSKFVRAQPAAAMQIAGRLTLPASEPKNDRWVTAFRKETRVFTGQGDKHDDQVDALAHGVNYAHEIVPAAIKVSRVGGSKFRGGFL